MQLKYWYLVLISMGMVWSVDSNACNQKIYDQLYLQVKTINLDIEVEKLDRMNRHYQYNELYEEPVPVNFNILRDLCNGQKVTYEAN